MSQTIKIKCPSCGAILNIKEQAGLEKASVTCPICKEKALFTDYAKVIERDSEATELPHGFKSKSESEDATLYGNAIQNAKGCLIEKSGKRWALHAGVNTVGRKLQSGVQQVDIPITDYHAGTSEERKMSRSHAKIEVVRLANGGCKYLLYNWQNKNYTYISGEPINSADKIVLHNGMVIKFANIDVTFILEDSEATTL